MGLSTTRIVAIFAEVTITALPLVTIHQLFGPDRIRVWPNTSPAVSTAPSDVRAIATTRPVISVQVSRVSRLMVCFETVIPHPQALTSENVRDRSDGMMSHLFLSGEKPLTNRDRCQAAGTGNERCGLSTSALQGSTTKSI